MLCSLARTGWNLRRRDGVSIRSHFLSFLSLFPAFAGGFDRYPAALILALIDERSQGRRGTHGHRSIADLYEPARRQPLQHRADGIA
jgi:hypothetical protein